MIIPKRMANGVFLNKVGDESVIETYTVVDHANIFTRPSLNADFRDNFWPKFDAVSLLKETGKLILDGSRKSNFSIFAP